MVVIVTASSGAIKISGTDISTDFLNFRSSNTDTIDIFFTGAVGNAGVEGSQR
jgi:hypothetical protein